MKKEAAHLQPDLAAVTKIIAGSIPIEAIYLFGSYAYGAPEEDSDIDLYLVFKDDMQMREYEALAAARKLMFGILNKSIDLLGHKKEKFLYRSTGFATIEKDVVQKGIKLYG
jgi:predicted nucleotidyltransferase